MFVWTPPHFWALAIKYREDYESAQVPMMPVVTTFKRTAAQILGYSVLVAAVSLVFAWTAGMGPLYWVSAVVLGAVFCGLALQLWRDPTEARAMRLFHWSITYVTGAVRGHGRRPAAVPLSVRPGPASLPAEGPGRDERGRPRPRPPGQSRPGRARFHRR